MQLQLFREAEWRSDLPRTHISLPRTRISPAASLYLAHFQPEHAAARWGI